MKNLIATFAGVLLATGCILPANGESDGREHGKADAMVIVDAGELADADVDGGLPQCSPLGGPSGRYCNTTDDGFCMTTVCNCTDRLGNKIPTTVTPMVGFDASQCAPAVP
jgi:hypothetical protein